MDGSQQRGQGPSSKSKKLHLPIKIQPTPEERERAELWNAPQSPVSGRDPSLRERLLNAARMEKLNMYAHEDLHEGQIRLLILKPAQDEKADISIELKRLTFEEVQECYEFAALSYHWGIGEADKPVFVESGSTPNNEKETRSAHVADVVLQTMRTMRKKRIYVKPNLYKALRCLRQKDTDIALWVDAICINQSDEEEKKSQVMKMAQLYTSADQVCIWLGSADADGRTDRAMDFIQEIIKEHDAENLITPAKATNWSELIYLLHSSWFSRRWVIQELALAKDAEVRCGEKSVHWRDFGDAISLFATHFDQIRKLFDVKKPPTESQPTISINSLGAKILVDEIGNIFHRQTDGSLFQPLQGLEALVSTLPYFDTSDPRDTIYALLNIAKETSSLSPMAPKLAKSQNPPPAPSYTADLLEVYTTFVRWVIRSTKSLDIICRQWALPASKERPKTDVTLPTWIKVAPDSAHGKQVERYRGRKDGDSFVGLPGARIYNASLDLGAEVRFGEDLVASSAPSTNTRTTSSLRNNTEASTILVQPQPTRTILDRPLPDTPSSHPDVVSNGNEPSINSSNKAQINFPRVSCENTRKRRLSHSGELPSEKRVAMSSGANNVLSGKSTPPFERTDSPSSNMGRPMKASIKRSSSLYVKGFQIGTVCWKTDPIPDGVIPRTALSTLGWKEGSSVVHTVPDRVWRTLVADRGPDGKNPPHLYHRACLRCLVKGTPNGHINTEKLLAAEPPEPIKGYLRRVQAVTWNRVVLEASSKDQDGKTLVGIGPPVTDIEDIVCILFGCSVPCILRGLEKTSEGEEYYKFVGEAFIYGEMDGEAVARLSQEQLTLKTQEFRLM